MRRRRGIVAATAVLAITLAYGSASITTGGASTGTGDASSAAGEKPPSYPIANTSVVPAGAQRLHYEVGPITVKPGQNSISFTRRIPQPATNGWIVGMRTNLHRADGSVPPVNVIHLHHGVWLNLASTDATYGGPERFFAAGEEKTVMQLPTGFGYAYKTSDRWLLNWMLHNNLSTPDNIWITYDIDMIPAGSTAAQGVQPAHPIWMDVQNGSAYPVFNVDKSATATSYTYPDQAANPYPSGKAKNTWTVPQDGVLLGTAGHVHPGGLHDDLWLTRAGATAPKGHAKPGSPDTTHLFRSVADYFEPAGKVSWDFAVTATPPTWRPIVHKGDVLSITTTYDSKNAGWYESMGIMVVWMADTTAGGTDPFQKPVDVATGELTHGHLPENNQHGGKSATDSYTDLTKASSHAVPSGSVIPIVDFAYQQGNMALGNSSVPTIPQGGTLTFRNDDASKGIYHTVTACAAPCTLSTGIAYPLANAKIEFDSGELGLGGPPAIGTTTWSVPKNLPPGTYTYFCRIHPFMRGAFRVVAGK